jgi:PilZ domain
MVFMTVVEPRIRVKREPRRHLNKKPAWISHDHGATQRQCYVMDVSPGGARIATDDAMDVGDSFELALVPDHPNREFCEVVWRRAKTYGIKFLEARPSDEPASADSAAGEND